MYNMELYEFFYLLKLCADLKGRLTAEIDWLPRNVYSKTCHNQSQMDLDRLNIHST